MPLAANVQRAAFAVTRTLQAAAAARIFGKPGILRAAESGDAALVQDHVLADAASVNKRDAWCDCPSFVFYNCRTTHNSCFLSSANAPPYTYVPGMGTSM